MLGSYAWGLGTRPGTAAALWGGMPLLLQRISTANMLPAALGYIAFTTLILFRLDPGRTRLFGRFGYGAFLALYAAILAPSALWMPLTFSALASPTALAVWSIRLVLAVIALASLGLLVALWDLKPQSPLWAWRLAALGGVFFCLQTVVMDAVLWSAFFHP